MTEPKVGDEIGKPTEGVDELDPDVRNDPVSEPADTTTTTTTTTETEDPDA